MRTRAYKSGFTLIEMLVVVAIIAILVSMVVGVAKRIDDQSKERLCRNTIALVGNALEQFRDFGYEYKSNDYDGLVFPLDCTNLSPTNPNPNLNLGIVLRYAIYPPSPITFVNIDGAYDPSFSGSAAMYFILSQVPDCRATLDKIDKSLLTNNSNDRPPVPISITVTSGAIVITSLPFTRIIDPWGTPLRYDYYPDFADYVGTWTNYLDYRNSAKKTFPVITSAGPDKQFDTADDISNAK
ncbi:MAG: type II secretion system protein [Sedimentisphaerales bacterium]|jgi:prepilin-type N-terminal cleavage/methylation domain-containing protein